MTAINSRTKNLVLLLLKVLAIGVCLTFIIDQCFFTIDPSVSPVFIISFIALAALEWRANRLHSQNFKPSHIPLVVIPLFFAVHFRAGIYWASNTFPLKDAYAVWLTLQESFDDFAYSMVRQYLVTTIPQALVITAILAAFLYVILRSTKQRLIGIAAYFVATIAFLFIDIPVLDYVHIVNDEPEKNASYSTFFAEKYVNPDSVKITPPEQKRNLILIYLESLETSFTDIEHGGNQSTDLIPEITEMAQQNLNFGRNMNKIGGGLDAIGSNHTFGAMHTRTLGIPNTISYKITPILHQYKSIYKILNANGYRQIFFQGNPGLYDLFRDFALDQKMDEVYGPDDLVERLNLDSAELIRLQGFKNVHDKDAFRFARSILDTIAEPFSLTFFTIDTHSPHGLYDPDCVKSPDESNLDERLKATAKCVSRELGGFIDSLKSKPYYENTSIVIFGDHLFMGTSLVKDSPNRKWVNIFINPAKAPATKENRLYSDVDMFPTILSSIDFTIDGDRLGFGTDLFSGQKTLVESIGIDSLNNEIRKMPSYLAYKSTLLQKTPK